MEVIGPRITKPKPVQVSSTTSVSPSKAQSLFVIGYLFHLLAISYFKATIVLVLRLQCNLNEIQSIMCFHMFQAATYFTAYFFGIIMSYSPITAFIFMIILYLLGGGAIGSALLFLNRNVNLVPFIPFALLAFGIGVGPYKAAVLKILTPLSTEKKFFMKGVFIELTIEVLLLGIASIFLLKFQVYIFLGLYTFSALLITISSISLMTDSNHRTEKDFKYFNVVKCTIYGLWRLLVFHGGNLNRIKRQDPSYNMHWMYRADGVFKRELVEALIIKFTLHKFYVWIAGIWIAVEVKYSYWILEAFLSDRRFFDIVFQPTQFLAIPPLISLAFLPCFAYWLAPLLQRSYYHSAPRQMCLGAFLLLFACALGWGMSVKMRQETTEFMEPDFKHTEIRVINGHFCPSGILTYFPMDLEVATIVQPEPAIETAFPVTDSLRPNIALKKEIVTKVEMINPLNEDTYLKYANLPLDDQDEVGDMETIFLKPTDSFTYLKTLDCDWDMAITVEAFGYCETLNKYTLKIPKLKKKNIDHVDVFIVRLKGQSQYLMYENMDYTKSPLQKPGVRVYVVFRDKLTNVVLKRKGVVLVTIRKTGPSEMIYVEVGDGPNLEIHALGKVVKFTHVLGPAEIIDLLVQVERGMVAVKVLYKDPPLLMNANNLLPQFIFVALGEILFGVVGLRYFINEVPQKLQYYVYMDWYLMQGFANIAIVIVNRIPWIVMHSQLSYLSMIVGGSLCFFIIMTYRNVYAVAMKIWEVEGNWKRK